MIIHYVILVAFVLVIIGALNWGLVGLLGIDAVARLFGTRSIVSRIIYCLIGVAAIVLIIVRM